MNIIERALTGLGLIRNVDHAVQSVESQARSEFARYHAHVVAQMGYGSTVSDHRSYGGKYPMGIPGTGSGRTLSHYDLRINARERYHDTTQAKALVDRFVDVVVGTGLQIEPTPQADLLGITSEEAEAWARNVATRFRLWSESKNQHRSCNMTFTQYQKVYARGMQLDGENFTRLFYSKDHGLLNPLQFEGLDPNQICGNAYTSTDGLSTSAQFNDGIRRDAQGREFEYTIWVPRTGVGYERVTIPARGEKSGRTFMLHGFVPDYNGQQRGYSRIGHAIQDFLNIADFEQAQVRKAINQSNLAFVSENTQMSPGDPLAGMSKNVAGRPVSATSPATSSTDAMTCNLLPEASFRIPGSTMVIAAQRGDTLKPVPNTAPADSYDKFLDALMSYLSASMSMPLEMLKLQFNSNYSASRAAILLFWRVAEQWRGELSTDCLDPVYEAWLTEEIAMGTIQAPGWFNPLMRAAWLSCLWIGQGAPDIDPTKTAKAVRERIEMGHTTMEREARNYNGSDATANRMKLRKEFEDYPHAPWELLKAGLTEDVEADDKNEIEEEK